MGCRSFVSIHTRLMVPRDPPPGVYWGVREASRTLFSLREKTTGKGLECFYALGHLYLLTSHSANENPALASIQLSRGRFLNAITALLALLRNTVRMPSRCPQVHTCH